MKRNPQFVNGYKAPEYLCKVQHDRWLQRIIWWLFRRYLLNEDYYAVTRRFTGPRPKGTNQVSTIKANATASRYYINGRKKPRLPLAVVRPIPAMDPWAGDANEDVRDLERA